MKTRAHVLPLEKALLESEGSPETGEKFPRHLVTTSNCQVGSEGKRSGPSGQKMQPTGNGVRNSRARRSRPGSQSGQGRTDLEETSESLWAKLCDVLPRQSFRNERLERLGTHLLGGLPTHRSSLPAPFEDCLSWRKSPQPSLAHSPGSPHLALTPNLGRLCPSLKSPSNSG